MPSVSGSDGSYSYFQKQFSDLADENAAERKKAKEREDERVSELERRQANELRDQEESYNRALSRSKDAANEALRSERETAKLDAERLKKDTYDRYGRLHQDQGAESRHQVEELQKNLEAQKNTHDEEMKKAEDTYSARLAHRERQHELDTEKAVAATRDGLEENHLNSIQNERDRYAQAAKESSARYENLDKTRLEEMTTQRRRYEGALSESRQDYDRRMGLAKSAYEKMTNLQQQNQRNAQLDSADMLRVSHERETRNLRNQIGDLVRAEKDYMKEGAQGKAEAVSEYEDDWRTKLAVQDGNHKREVADLKNQSARMEANLSRQNDANLREKDLYFAKVINQQNIDNHKVQKDQMDEFMRDRAQMDNNHRKDYAQQQKLFEDRMDDAARETNQALTNQAKTLGQNAENQRTIDRYQMDKLTAALHERQTSADTSLISPAAEAAMRKQISDQYQKTAQADQDRRLRENELLRDDYRHQLQENRDNHILKENHLNRALASQENDDRARFNAHVADLEYMKDSALKTQERDHARERENLNKNYSRTLDHQSKEYEEAMNVARDEAQTRMAAQREEFEFKEKMAQREFSTKYNETVRDYERKLSDQKTEYEGLLADQRAQASTQARETERRFKNSLDAQERSNEQKLAQLEAQHKERERYITQNYQEELDKMRHSNQLLIKKRG